MLRNRQMSKDDVRKVPTGETLIEVAMIRLLIARQGPRKWRLPKHALRNLRKRVVNMQARLAQVRWALV